jgi:hypothetical protein
MFARTIIDRFGNPLERRSEKSWIPGPGAYDLKVSPHTSIKEAKMKTLVNILWFSRDLALSRKHILSFVADSSPVLVRFCEAANQIVASNAFL